MSIFTSIQITILTPEANNRLIDNCLATCELLIQSIIPLPHALYIGTIRVGGSESTATGLHPCRLLKHFTIEYIEDTSAGTLYKLSVDLKDEDPFYSAIYPSNSGNVRKLADSVDVIFRRIAGVFGRHCEQYRPSSVILTDRKRKSLDDIT